MVAGVEWQQDRPDHENTDGSIIMMTDQLWYKNLSSFLAFLRNTSVESKISCRNSQYVGNGMVGLICQFAGV